MSVLSACLHSPPPRTHIFSVHRTGFRSPTPEELTPRGYVDETCHGWRSEMHDHNHSGVWHVVHPIRSLQVTPFPALCTAQLSESVSSICDVPALSDPARPERMQIRYLGTSDVVQRCSRIVKHEVGFITGG